jgi:hypothetical protein
MRDLAIRIPVYIGLVLIVALYVYVAVDEEVPKKAMTCPVCGTILEVYRPTGPDGVPVWDLRLAPRERRR